MPRLIGPLRVGRNAFSGTSIQSARPIAKGRPDSEKMADPARRFRPSIESGHPTAMYFSPATTLPSIRALSSPSTIAWPRERAGLQDR
jgi:hypothetical protein